MAQTYFNNLFVRDGEYIINHIRTKRIKGKYLVTTDHGAWIYLDKREYDLLMRHDLPEELLKTLEEKGIVLTKRNIDFLLKAQAKRYQFLFFSAGLHIIVPTLRCNQKCIYCHSASRKMSETEYDMDEKTARGVLEFIFQCPSSKITIEFQGGDSLMNFGLFQYIVKEAKRMNRKHGKKVRFALVTNLTLMKEEYLEWILKEGVDICTSLDGPKEVHDFNREYETGAGTYDAVTKWIKTFRERKIPVSALMVTTRKSLDKYKEIIDEYIHWDMNMIQLKYLDKIGFAESEWEKIGYDMDEFIDFWKKSLDYIIELNKRGVKIRERLTEIMLQKILTENEPGFLDFRNPCGVLCGQIAYNYNGDIYTCDEARGFELFNMGNVAEIRYADLLNLEGAQDIMSASFNDLALCDACVYKPYCGLCPVVTYAEQGNIIPKLANNSKCLLMKAQFGYIFDKILFDEDARKILFSWVAGHKKDGF